MSIRFASLLAGLLMLVGGLAFAAEKQVVVYTSLDREFSEPILKEFSTRTGIEVLPVYDTEAVKTVGLVNRLLAERNRPRCDVFWNNEILRSLQLKKEGLTEAYRSPAAATIPAAMKDPEGHWTGFAARARVILVNKKLLPNAAEWPRRVQDLADTKWKGRCAVARPLAGTTNSHAAVIWGMAGAEAARQFWSAALANAQVASGNGQARDAVVAGEAAWCLTDSDDAQGAIADGAAVEMILPTADLAGSGTLVLPNTLVLLKNSPNPQNGRALIDYLLSEDVEGRLAASRSAQIPVRAKVPGPAGIPPLREEQILKVDWEKAYGAIAPATAWLAETLEKRP